MKVWVALILDRHTDPIPTVFSAERATRKFAIAEARAGSMKGKYKLNHYGGFDTYSYGTEDDRIQVQEVALDEEVS